MYVIKKDGTKSPFNFEKIETMVLGATSTIDGGGELANDILSDFTLLLRNEITTTEIQEQLLNTVKKKISIDNPKMGLVAGKLMMSTIISDAEKLRGFEFGELVKLYKYNMEFGMYEDKLDIPKYLDILKGLEKYIDRSLNYTYNYTSVASWKLRYLHRGETPVEVFAIISARLSLSEDRNVKDSIKLAREYLEVLSKQKISLATPFLLNLRLKDGNLSSCFINTIPDDLGGQYDVLKDMALISKNGGGIGNYFGNIRAKGSRIKQTYGIADSIIPYATLVNQTMTYVNQQGKRKGASTIALPVWHADILEFLELVTESGDIRRKAMDLFLQIVTEETFMKSLINNETYPLVCPLEVKEVLGFDIGNDMSLFSDNFADIMMALEEGQLRVGKIVRARDIFKAAMGATLISGTPYWTFFDNLNNVNPMKDVGTIKCFNLCVESTSVTTEDYAHTCNLVSLVLPNIELSGDSSDLQETSKLAVDILDTIVDISTPPTDKAKAHNDAFRVIGIGAMGLADVMAINKKSYENHVDWAGELFERIALFTLQASITRAKEFGTFPMYEKSEWSKGRVYSRDLEWYYKNSRYYEEWVECARLLEIHGIRNAQLHGIAPNTSSSILQGVTASILPTFSKFHTDSSALGALPVMPKYIDDAFWYYKEYKHHSIIDMNTFIAEIQKWSDTGISYEWVIDLDSITINDLENYYTDAWEKGLKSIYYIRFLRSDGSTSEKEECVSCAG